jgi:hypothetical protein
MEMQDKGGFGDHREEVWKRLAEELGGRFVGQGNWQTDQVRVQVDRWIVTLDIHAVPGFKSEPRFTRLRAPLANPGGLRFEIHPKGLLASISAFFGVEHESTGFTGIDDDFVVQANDPDGVRRLLADEEVRRLIRVQPDGHLRLVAAEDDYPEPLGEGVDELHFEVPGVIDEHDRLHALYRLFAEVLHRLTLEIAGREDGPSR